MQFLATFSDYILPLVLFVVLCLGLFRKKAVYDEFTEGAKDGFQVVLGILPTLIGLMVAVGVLRASGALDALCRLLFPVTEFLHFPSELLPLVIVKSFSSSAATGLLLDIYGTHGPDSYLGELASVILSCTETIFYTMAVYFMTAKVTKTRYTLAGAITATLAGIVMSCLLVAK